MSKSLSVVVIARKPSGLEQCLQSVLMQMPAAQKVHLILDGASTPDAVPAGLEGLVTVHKVSSGKAAVLRCNELVPSLRSDLVAFLDGDGIPAPGWGEALSGAAEKGATVMAGPVEAQAPWPAGSRAAALGHDPAGGGCFFPYASHSNLAILPGVFTDLCGFDPRMASAMGADLCLRAQLDGHELSFVPDARVSSTLFSQQVRRKRLRTAHDSAALDWKYHRFAFKAIPFWTPPLRLWADSARLGLVDLFSGSDSQALRLAASRMPNPSRLTEHLAYAAAYGRLLVSRRPPKFLLPRSTGEAVSSRPLPQTPLLGIAGRPATAVKMLSSLVDLNTEIAVPPPLQIQDLAGRWQEPPPWSLQLARDARRSGWDIPGLLAARRLEHAFPKTLGEAVVCLHAIYAQLHGKRLFGLAATGPEAAALLDLVRPDAVIGVGSGAPGATVRATPYEILRHPGHVLECLRNLVDTERRRP